MEKDLSKEILEKIKKERIRPKSKWHFLLKNYVVWLVFSASIVLGALAFSVILHLLEINDWDAYYRVSKNFFTFLLLTMPYFWLVCFLLFAGLAYLYLKHTRKGYRYEFARIVLLNLGLSFVFGSVLYGTGAGREAESRFAEQAPFYKGIRERREDVWFRPEEGVIIGRVVEIAESEETLKLNDPKQITWVVDTREAEYFQGFVITEGFMIKVFGEERGSGYFIAEEIRPLRKERARKASLTDWRRN